MGEDYHKGFEWFVDWFNDVKNGTVVNGTRYYVRLPEKSGNTAC